jgi:hypothetical protein
MSNELNVFMNKITRQLKEHYHQFPFDLESQQPEIRLDTLVEQQLVESIPFKISLSTTELMRLFIKGVTELECFTYRAVNKVNGELVYWNALSEPFVEFKQPDTVIYQTDAPYPTTDMITAWCHNRHSLTAL